MVVQASRQLGRQLPKVRLRAMHSRSEVAQDEPPRVPPWLSDPCILAQQADARVQRGPTHRSWLCQYVLVRNTRASCVHPGARCEPRAPAPPASLHANCKGTRWEIVQSPVGTAKLWTREQREQQQETHFAARVQVPSWKEGMLLVLDWCANRAIAARVLLHTLRRITVPSRSTELVP